MRTWGHSFRAFSLILVFGLASPLWGQDGGAFGAGAVQPSGLWLRAEGGGQTLSLAADASPFHWTENEVIGPRLVEVPGSSVRLALWSEVGSDGATVPFYGISLDGRAMAAVRSTSYVLKLRRAQFDPAVRVPVPASLAADDGTNLYVVQFVTQPLEEFRAGIEGLGATVYKFVAQHAHIVKMDPDVRDQVAALPYVRWVGPYHPAYRLDTFMYDNQDRGPELFPLQRYNIEVFEAGMEQKSAVAKRIEAMGGQVDTPNAGKHLLEATLTPEQLFEVIRWDEVLFVDRWSPYTQDMDIVRQIGGADYIETVAGYTGAGVRGEIIDLGFSVSHPDFASRPLITHTSVDNDSHGTACAGICFGDGTGDPTARGLMPDGQGIVADWDVVSVGTPRYDHTGELVQAPYYAVFQTASVGSYQTTEYTTVSADTDEALFDFDILHCQSQSNMGTRDSRPQAWAKNIVSGGAVNHYNTLTRSDDCWCNDASIGPAEDGRIKPDLCFFYDDTYTTYSTGSGYGQFGGTSGATPSIAGHFGLFFQMWADETGGFNIFGHEVAVPGGTVFENRPHMTTAKAVMINTATQYSFTGTSHDLTRVHQGWGMPDLSYLYDMRDKISVIDETDLLGNMESVEYVAYVNPGEPELRVTLVYADPAGVPSAAQQRINDLSLKVTSPSATFYWGNNGLLAGNWSTSGGVANEIDTVENVFVENPESGIWTIEVVASEINEDGHVETPELDADFALVVSGGILSNCTSDGRIVLDRDKYMCEGQAGIRVVDCDLNTDDQVIETVEVTIDSTTEPGGETVVLTETAPETADFRGTIDLSTVDAVGVLQVSAGDTVTATYIDADDGQGGVNVEVIDTAVVDCTPPAISNVQTVEIEPHTARVTFNTDEPTVGSVRYGEACGSLTETANQSGYGTDHSVLLSGLDEDSTYFYVVDAEDEAGNSNTDDNGGACYSFSTPDIPDFFTEEFVSDNDLDNLSLIFTPNGSYDYYYGCVEEEITELPTDPSGGTTLSLSDDDYEAVTLSGAQVSIYGTSYSTFYPGSNGYITFGSGDSDYDETLAEHFDLPRISGIYDDLDPAQAGTVSWKQLADRAVVTWSGVTEHNSSNSNTFQIEMYFDGKIVISYLSVAAADGIAGLSEGEGLDPDFYETDLSDMGPCGPQPPDAFSGSADTAVETPVTISLQANDDGLPDPPAALTYIVTTLPGHGTLYDTGDSSEITSVPYTLYNYGNQVDYHPEAAFHDTDTFQFMANDGGTPVEGGGDSNTAVITITVGGPAWDPVAYNVDWGTGLSVPADIELSGSDPNSDPLTFVIESLPPAGEGYLSDPGAGLIETVPYTLVGGGDVVRYYPPYGQYLVTDFDFSAWDATTGSNVATVTVTVGVPQVIHSFDLDTDPGWSTEEQWDYGQPTGGGSHNGDPSSGYTGQNVYGYNLSGDYALGMTETYYLTTTAIDCSSVTGTELRFQRWLGVEAGYWDQAIIEVSNNGVDWTPVWEHAGGSSTISESSWSLQSYDISSEADDEATVYLRWGMGPTDTSTTYPGWNLDDIEIWGGYELPPGDFNADLAVDLVDYVSFVDCMAGPDVPPNPQEPLSSEDHCLGAFDFDEDSDVDLDDFGGFQAYFGS